MHWEENFKDIFSNYQLKNKAAEYRDSNPRLHGPISLGWYNDIPVYCVEFFFDENTRTEKIPAARYNQYKDTSRQILPLVILNICFSQTINLH